MRKIFVLPVYMITVAFFLLSSCKKSSVKEPLDRNEIILQAKEYFESVILPKQARLSNQSNSTISKSVDWDMANIDVRADNVIIAPLKFHNIVTMKSDLVPNISTSAESEMKFVIYKTPDDGFRAKVFTFIPDANFMSRKTSSFSGVVRVEDWGGNNAKNYLFRNGKTHDISETSTGTASRSLGRTTCYYLRHYLCDYNYSTGTMSNCELIKETFLYCETASDENEEIDWISDDTGGGALYVYEDQFDGSTTIEPNSEEAIGSYQQEEVDQITGELKLNASYSWKCGTGRTLVAGNLYNWTYWSYELGVLEKVDVLDDWKFKELNHSSIERIGITPPSHDYTHSLAFAYSNIAPDKRTARMDVSYVVYERITGLTQTKSWQVSAATICKAP